MTKLTGLKKVTIRTEKGEGVLTRSNEKEGAWDVTVDGRSGGCLYYTDEQVLKIIASKPCELDYEPLFLENGDQNPIYQ